ncbi:MAG TPA: hypothetical protein PLG17_01860 [Thermodesulfobacteriota bacterium]|nr:hypothetical protein [Thermodesulfobacteriota bacterium]HQO77237.1 hypothetical protein [Thermodesulfobacteriota bacterium]
MKKVLLYCLVVVAVIVLSSPPGKVEETAKQLSSKKEYDYWVHFNYFAHDSSHWWTGLAILNPNDIDNDLIIKVYDQEGDEEAWGEFTVDNLEQVVFTMDDLDFIDHGSLPGRGHFSIGATEDFAVVKFTGNRDSGAFSEVEKEAQFILPE